MNTIFSEFWRIFHGRVLKNSFNVSVGNFRMIFLWTKNLNFTIFVQGAKIFGRYRDFFRVFVRTASTVPRRTVWGKNVNRNPNFFSSFLDFAQRLLNFGKVFLAGLCLNCFLRVYNNIFRERSFLEIYFFFHHFRSLRKIFCWSFFGGAVASAPTCPLGKIDRKGDTFWKRLFTMFGHGAKTCGFFVETFPTRSSKLQNTCQQNFSGLKFFLENSIFFSLFCDFDDFFAGLLVISF